MNLEVKGGQVFGMLGPNGSGKTTTLGMLMGVINPTSGDYSWFGKPPDHQLRKKIGAVLEHPIFYPYLSGQKNLELNAKIKQCSTENISKVLELVELKDRRDDEVQKVCTHFAVLKRGNMVHCGPVNDTSRDSETVEVNADAENLGEVLMKFSGTASVSSRKRIFSSLSSRRLSRKRS